MERSGARDRPSGLWDRAAVERAFHLLGDHLVERGVRAHLYLYGGTALALTHAGRRPTPDLDAVFQPRHIVLEEAAAVADELGLPHRWLGRPTTARVAPGGDAAALSVLDHPGLRVTAASPEHILASMVLAARHRDAEDIRFLVGRLGLADAERVLSLCAYVFPDDEMPERARAVLQDVFDR
ncbi:nucleotidyl transferase AbiEii/AbiGii toxin family protein [Virgisporangium aliadipatigenens]|uniref:nucleotidyl transferase AbiEii/AbiGii toxin family protein n=1 Tax=Virgisporangium aliadipatigenens TaxID=741659 RepID=UPI00194591E7|nr:nucleotidyl transferase AbiEii/AbiGii toxin family protein [Virgisporangium aliadipatigenens]